MAETNYQPPANTGLQIIHLDDDLIALNKPSGLLSVPGRGPDKQDCLLSRVQADYPEVLVVHRLDMSTSGLLLLARHTTAQSALSRLFAERQIQKTYHAIVSGKPNPAEGDIDLPLITDWPNRPRQKIDFDIGKAALTHYKTLSYNPEAQTSRIQLQPHTGRSHQLRVHMQAIGCAILGDDLYAPEPVRKQADRLLLHASVLHFPHPIQHGTLHLHCPADF